MITLDEITLPADLHWQDETDWSPVEQSAPFYNLDGSMVVEQGLKLAGRSITLAGAEDAAWLKYSVVQALLAYSAEPGRIMTLTLHDGRTFSVMFRHHDGGPVSVQPVVLELPHEADDDWWGVIRLMEVG